VPLDAQWLYPPIASAETRRVAAECGPAFVKGKGIAETTRDLSIRK
jgi:hypothetical protein